VNAFPEESVRLFNLAQQGASPQLDALYAWFLPLLRLDTVPRFVQYIKQMQEYAGTAPRHVRPPRLELTPAEQDEMHALYRSSLEKRPQ
jgi:4-hydroxy-tetrahydrodipicolinate synthase